MTHPTVAEVDADRADEIMEALHRGDSIALRHLAVSATDDEEHDRLLKSARRIDEENESHWAYDQSIGN